MKTTEFEVLCPLSVRSTEYGKADEPIVSFLPCAEALYLEYATSYGIYPEDLSRPEYMDPDAWGPNAAHTSGWQVICGNGHVLFTSDSQDEDARFSTADAVELRKLLDRIEAAS